MSSEYCGVIDHDDDCLCDVIIPNETPWVGDAIQDMWMGQEIVNLIGYTQEWDDDSILKYLEDLVFAKDNWNRYEIESSVTVGESYPAQLREEIRMRLRCSTQPSIRAVAEQMDLSHADLMFVLFTNRRHMTMEELENFERDVLERNFPSAHGLGIKYGMPYKSAHKLHSYWGVPYGKPTDKRSPITILIDTILMSNEAVTNRDVSDRIFLEIGERVSLDKIRNRRHYLKNKM